MKRLLTFAVLTISVISSLANKTDHEQILVFRNTGEVNLFYSDEIKSIECSNEDLNGDLHELPICQKFNLQDTTIIIPINEIDSVAFGPRNQIVPKSDARRLGDEDLRYIIRYDGDNLYYKVSTPTNILPKVNEKLYYNDFSDLFPIGLCVKVSTINQIDGEIKVALIDVAPDEMFKVYFCAGETNPLTEMATRAINFDGAGEIESGLEKDDSSISLAGNINFNVRYVANLTKRYHHADFSFDIGLGIAAKFKSEAEDPIKIESRPKTLINGYVGGIILPKLQIGAFLDIAAEIEAQYSFNSIHKFNLSWTKRGDEILIEEPLLDLNEDQPDSSITSQIEAYINGNLHFGLMPRLDIGLLFDRAGIGINLKIGPELKAGFSLGMLNDLSNQYSPEVYAKANIEVNFVKLKMETYTYNAKSLFSIGEVERHELPFKAEMSFFNRTLQLFPDFSSRAVKAKATPITGEPTIPTDAITVATKTNTDIEYPLEIGFELTDTVSRTAISQIFLNDSIDAKTDTIQGFSTEFPIMDNLSDIDIEKTVVSPIFKYRGYIIKAVPANIMDNIFYSPIITAMANSGNYIVSGQPIIGSATFDERCFIQGNLMPVPGEVSAYKRTFTTVTGVLLEKDSMLGNWINSDDELDITFNDDSTGTYNGEKFTYQINYPQTGDIRMTFSNNRYLIATVVEQSDNETKIIFKPSNRIITIKK